MRVQALILPIFCFCRLGRASLGAAAHPAVQASKAAAPFQRALAASIGKYANSSNRKPLAGLVNWEGPGIKLERSF
jgi:hypothetical protein